jgi:hypothetical protein
MKNTLASDYTIAYLTLFSGLSISAVAVYYSVIGLVSIFAASAIPIMIMGIALEVSKLIATVWLKRHWKDASFLILTYLTIAVLVLMFITSMGIFGFLSRAHSDQAMPTSNISDKVLMIDEKIKTQRDNIEVSRKALAQMDAAVDQVMIRSTSEKGANRSVQIRRSQSKERVLLQTDITNAQTVISRLNEERAPLTKDLRKVEAEVGPIKSVAALIYGDTLDTSILERAVRWMIVIIVSVFDPMAIMLLLACQHSFTEIRKQKSYNEDVLKKYDDFGLQLVADKDVPPMPEIVEIKEEIVETKEEIVEIVAIEEEIVDVSPIVEEDTSAIDEYQLERLHNIELLVNNALAASKSITTDEFVGETFPKNPIKGQQYERIDYDPPRLFVFDGVQWINLQ